MTFCTACASPIATPQSIVSYVRRDASPPLVTAASAAATTAMRRQSDPSLFACSTSRQSCCFLPSPPGSCSVTPPSSNG